MIMWLRTINLNYQIAERYDRKTTSRYDGVPVARKHDVKNHLPVVLLTGSFIITA